MKLRKLKSPFWSFFAVALLLALPFLGSEAQAARGGAPGYHGGGGFGGGSFRGGGGGGGGSHGEPRPKALTEVRSTRPPTEARPTKALAVVWPPKGATEERPPEAPMAVRLPEGLADRRPIVRGTTPVEITRAAAIMVEVTPEAAAIMVELTMEGTGAPIMVRAMADQPPGLSPVWR